MKLLWNVTRLPVLSVLVLLEPTVRLVLASLALLGLLTCLFFWWVAPGHIALWRMAGMSIGFGLLLRAYYSVLGALSRKE